LTDIFCALILGEAVSARTEISQGGPKLTPTRLCATFGHIYPLADCLLKLT